MPLKPTQDVNVNNITINPQLNITTPSSNQTNKIIEVTGEIAAATKQINVASSNDIKHIDAQEELNITPITTTGSINMSTVRIGEDKVEGGVDVDGTLLIKSCGIATINPLYRSGYLVVKNMVQRNAIDRSELEIGTRCWVDNEQKFYKLTLSPGKIKVWADDNETDSFDGYATTDRHGTVSIGENLTTNEQGQLIVDVVHREEKDSNKPISAGAVYEILGDIKIRLDNI